MPNLSSRWILALFLATSFAGNIAEAADDLVAVPPDVAKAIVIIEGDAGSGSGFFVSWRGKLFIVTNTHVVSGNGWIEAIAYDGERIEPSAMFAAIGHDVLIMEAESAPGFLTVADDVSELAAVGDEVLVAGNAQGAAVVGGLPGGIRGIGPERIEVDCEFVEGNSGSPIYHKPSGKVIGVATYATIRKFNSDLAEDSPFKEIRRFGYRLDSIREWQAIDWAYFRNEAIELRQIVDLSDVLFEVAIDIADGRLDSTNSRYWIGRAAQRYRLSVTRSNFLESVRMMARRDIDEFVRYAKYDYHRSEAERLVPFRQALADYFEHSVSYSGNPARPFQ